MAMNVRRLERQARAELDSVRAALKSNEERRAALDAEPVSPEDAARAIEDWVEQRASLFAGTPSDFAAALASSGKFPAESLTADPWALACRLHPLETKRALTEAVHVHRDLFGGSNQDGRTQALVVERDRLIERERQLQAQLDQIAAAGR